MRERGTPEIDPFLTRRSHFVAQLHAKANQVERKNELPFCEARSLTASKWFELISGRQI